MLNEKYTFRMAIKERERERERDLSGRERSGERRRLEEFPASTEK